MLNAKICILAAYFLQALAFLPKPALKVPSFHSPLYASPSDGISLGAPHNRPLNGAFISPAGVKVDIEVEDVVDSKSEINKLVDMIDDYKGIISTFLIPFSVFCA
jgi:hypothetical protein